MLKIKLSRIGKRGYPVYRIVINEARTKRDGKYLEQVGLYDPNTKPKTIKLNTKRIEHWQSKGAKPTDTVRRLIKNYA